MNKERFRFQISIRLQMATNTKCSLAGRLNSNSWKKKYIWKTAKRSESHLSVSGSRKTSSLSSPVPTAPGTTRPGVDVLTMGTDWEACSVVSDWATSEKAVTGSEGHKNKILIHSLIWFFSTWYQMWTFPTTLLTQLCCAVSILIKEELHPSYQTGRQRQIPGAATCNGVVGTLRPPDSSSWVARNKGLSYIPRPEDKNHFALKKKTNLKNSFHVMSQFAGVVFNAVTQYNTWWWSTSLRCKLSKVRVWGGAGLGHVLWRAKTEARYTSYLGRTDNKQTKKQSSSAITQQIDNSYRTFCFFSSPFFCVHQQYNHMEWSKRYRSLKFLLHLKISTEWLK